MPNIDDRRHIVEIVESCATAQDEAFIMEFVSKSIARSTRAVGAVHHNEEIKQAAKRAMDVAMRAHRMRESKAERDADTGLGFVCKPT